MGITWEEEGRYRFLHKYYGLKRLKSICHCYYKESNLCSPKSETQKDVNVNLKEILKGGGKGDTYFKTVFKNRAQ